MDSFYRLSALPLDLMPMNPGDLDEVLAIEISVCPFPWGRGNFADSLGSGYSAWVARIGGEMVGYFVVMPVVDEAHLLSISVAKKFQGKGYGARLLSQVLKLAREYGATTVLLEVRPSNAKALRLYQHFGFREIGRRKDYYPAHQGREDALVLRRELEEGGTA